MEHGALLHKLLPLDSWTILFWRGPFGGGLIAAALVLKQGRAGLKDLVQMGRKGWLVASLSTLGIVSFIPALQMTSVSNVAIIIAMGPFVAAALAWIWRRHCRHHRRYQRAEKIRLIRRPPLPR